MLRRDFMHRSLGGLAMAAAGISASSGPADADDVVPIVTTGQGRLRGSAVGGIYTFKGVRFAAPPTGSDRLLPPRPPAAWDGVRDALAFGPKPPQPAYPPPVANLVPPEFVGAGDDCLTLNIWSSDLGAAKQPVMVWIAGGMFEYHATGASPWYDGSRFARDGIVLVTINYRVGAEGFLYLGDGVANLGLLDQLAALRWVRDNIAAFGGDPDNVTIFGESAGGLSVGILLSLPRSKGLFRRAIVESGGAHHVASASTAERIGRRLADKLGVPSTREAIAALPVDRVLAAQEALRGDLMTSPDPGFWGEVLLTGLPWEPVVDGNVIPERPIDRIIAGAGADVDVLAGSNIEEWRLFLVPGGMIDQITPEALAAMIAACGLLVDAAITEYRALHPNSGVGDLFAAVMTDWYWRIPAMRLADAHAAKATTSSTHMYEFAWRSPQFGGRLGASHGLEIPFAFDNLGNDTERLLGPSPPQRLADAMHRAWVEFARTGDPGWPEYDFERRATMRFNITSAVVNDPLQRERALWDGVR